SVKTNSSLCCLIMGSPFKPNGKSGHGSEAFSDLLFLSCVCITEKPGVCPISNIGACVELCSQDGNCPKDEKCCSNGCGHQCMPPYKEKPGVCPSSNIGACVELCSQDSNCPNDEKCCSNGCGHQCTLFSPCYKKPGVCPKPNPEDDMMGPCIAFCSQDGNCLNDEKCCSKRCGLYCMSPYKGIYIVILM
uniref:WAP domain-containing protein n=1 Tax=Sinocyclocheilus grahami TaxID=75366 RepID=A0A672M0Z7_SINGR